MNASLSLDRFPRCRAYLKAMRVKLTDPEMTDFWFACILADAVPERDLVAAKFDLGAGPVAERDGAALLGKLEAALGRAKAQAISAADMESLKAFLGSRGVKVSNLPDDAAYWRTASILWPHAVKKGRAGPLTDLVKIIRGMPKKSRQAARENLRKVPADWRA